MNYADLSKGKKVAYGIIVSLIFVLTLGTVWYVNHIIPFMMDDDWYATLLYSDKKIKNLLDIFEAQKWHYMNWGGRSITHTMLQLTILAGSTVADVVNTVLVLLTGMIVLGITETMTRTRHAFFERVLIVDAIMGLILALNANWEMSMFWQAGASNYLYITVFILLFIWVYIREIPYDCFGSKEPLPLVNIWIIPLALMAGWSNENMGPTVFIFTVATMVYVNKVEHIVQPWMVLGSIFSFLGSVACIAAPGTFVRSKQVMTYEYGILWKSYLHGFYETRAVFEYLFLAILITLIMIMLCKAVCAEKLGVEIVMVLALAILSWGGMALSPHYPDRATYGTMLLLIISFMAIGYRILNKKPAMRKFFFLGAGLLWLRGMFFLYGYIGIHLGWITEL